MPISLIPQSNSSTTFTVIGGSAAQAHLCAVSGNYLYVGSSFTSTTAAQYNDPYIDIFDISNPSLPYKASTWTCSNVSASTQYKYIRCIHANNNKLMIATVTNSTSNPPFPTPRLYIYDITSPLSPSWIREDSLSSSLFSLTGPYNYAAVCSDSDYCYSTFSNKPSPGAPVLIYLMLSLGETYKSNYLKPQGYYSTGIVSKNFLGTSGYTTYLFSIENVVSGSTKSALRSMLVNKDTPSLTSIVRVNGSSEASLYKYYFMQLIGNYIYAFSSSSVTSIIDVFDISTPTLPVLVNTISDSRYSSAATKNQESLVLFDLINGATSLYDLTINPENPTKQINSININSRPITSEIGYASAVSSPSRNQNSIAIDSNNYVYVTYPSYLQTFYLYSSESSTTTTTTLPIVVADRPIQLKSVQTVLVTPEGRTIATDASNSRGSTSTIDAQSLSFGPLAAGETSDTKIIYLNVPYANAIRNIKIGLADTGSVPFSTTSFGIEIRESLDYNMVPDTYFDGLNTDSLANNSNNVSVANAGENFSQYVYINMKVPDTQAVGDGIIELIWFFDYA